MIGWIVTWDVDSADPRQCARVRRFVFGHTVAVDGRMYHSPGFVELDGVRCLGQSVLFVSHARLEPLRPFFRSEGVDHVVTEATLGSILPNEQKGRGFSVHPPGFCPVE